MIRYVFQITEKFPKKERFVLTSRIQNSALNVFENLIQANETYVDFKKIKTQSFYEQNDLKDRRSFQNKALAETKKIGFFIRLVLDKKYISFNQYEHFSKLIDEVRKMIAGWISSDKRRINS